MSSRLAFRLKKLSKNWLMVLLPFLLGLACQHENTHRYKAEIPNAIALETLRGNIPELDLYLNRVDSALLDTIPVLIIPKSELYLEAYQAQMIALQNKNFKRNCWHFESEVPLHSEITQVSEEARGLFKVELYNFFYNSVSVAEVDLESKKVLRVSHASGQQPKIRKELQDLAVKVALQYPEVAEFVSEKNQTYLSKAERSRHLCTAPVFQNNDQALYTLIDLHNWTMIGYKYLNVEELTADTKITERMLQNEFVMENFCNKEVHLSKGDWELDYMLTESDGLEIKNVFFQNKAVLRSAKLVDWHVNYPFGDGYGFTDAMGCPMFSSAAVVAFDKPEIISIDDSLGGKGFNLIQDFRSPVWPLSCNYRYQNLFSFYTNGTIRISGVNLGLGCGEGGTYRPVFRVDLFPNEKGSEKLWSPNGNPNKEFWSQGNRKDTLPIYAIGNKSDGYHLVYEEQQWSNSATPLDLAYSYVSVLHADRDEGVSSLATVGGHENKNFRQGPDQFISNQESLNNKDLVLWYVPQIKNSNKPGHKYCWVDQEVKKGKENNVVWPGSAGIIIKAFQNCNFCE